MPASAAERRGIDRPSATERRVRLLPAPGATPRALAADYLAALDAGDADRLLALLDEHVVIESDGRTIRGIAAARGCAEALVAGQVADRLRAPVEDRETVVLEYTSRTGHPVCDILRIGSGRIVELRRYSVPAARSNLETKAELAASRARVVATADEERRRLVRDLHDGAQARLVQTVLTLRLADQALADAPPAARTLVAEALEAAECANCELRELARGILPSVLTRGGLQAALAVLAARLRLPVEVDVPAGRLPAAVEATAYFVVAEALTNIAKHARASRAAVSTRVREGRLHVEVRDDGVGGARSDGNGLLGLRDRLAALGGSLELDSRPGRGTRIAAAIPVAT